MPEPRTDREAALYAAFEAVAASRQLDRYLVTRVAVDAALDALLALGWDVPR